MKILVTGANGFLGTGIVKQLLDDGHNVIATGRKLDRVDNRAEKIVADLFKIEDPFDFFGKPDVLLHLAWRNGFVHNNPSHIDDLPLHCRFLNEMVSDGIKKIAVMGSMHEVGFWEGAIDEKTPCFPQSLYGISKNSLRLFSELICKNAGIPLQWLRGYYIVSPLEYGCSIFSKIAVSASEGKAEFPFTSGTSRYDFLDYEDFCRYAALAVSQDEITGIINICSGEPVSLGERVERFIKENHFNVQLKYGAFPDRPYDSKAVWGDSDKIRKIIENGK